MACSHTRRRIPIRIPVPGDFPRIVLWLQLYYAESSNRTQNGDDPHMETSPNGYCSHFGTDIRPDLPISMVFSAALFVFFTVYLTKNVVCKEIIMARYQVLTRFGRRRAAE